MSIIVSDLEGTLTTGSSWRGLRRYFRMHYDAWAYDRFFLKWIAIFPLVQLGIMNRREVMTSWMLDEISLFRGNSPQKFNKMAEWVVENTMWPNRRKDVLLEINLHRQNGAKVAIVSGAYQPIAEAFARRMDAISIGSPLIFQNGKLEGVTLPINSYEHKRKNIQDQLSDAKIASAYGDTTSDIPMMEMSADPVAVYPSKHLRQIAEKRNWRILDEHSGSVVVS
ncbi:MAG: haloacid dehalogenase-like hydrolase [Anaerolineales bacterium]|nr:haloacid dehalogenase-like hydrolase [Chloroflexota bacterium]MBL6981046.1 haloacid dehalogenase-like hydrolase [Anaerolineales bacterium]